MKGKLMEKAFRANIHGITPDCYLWTNPIPERIVHYSKQRDPKEKGGSERVLRMTTPPTTPVSPLPPGRRKCSAVLASLWLANRAFLSADGLGPVRGGAT
ncbi:unnamed protein product [Boreogadus saida]